VAPAWCARDNLLSLAIVLFLIPIRIVAFVLTHVAAPFGQTTVPAVVTVMVSEALARIKL
jgi:hypothetical protein